MFEISLGVKWPERVWYAVKQNKTTNQFEGIIMKCWLESITYFYVEASRSWIAVRMVRQCWLVVWVLWHINLYRLFNAKSIFIQIVNSLFQTIQFSMSIQFNCQKTFLFQAIQFIQMKWCYHLLYLKPYNCVPTAD